MKYKVGDNVIIYQDTKSSICKDFYGKGKIMIDLDFTNRYYVKSLNANEYSPTELWVHPDDMRPVTKLDKLL